MEHEVNHCLPFLGIVIKKKKSDVIIKIAKSQCIGKSRSGQYMNFGSECPIFRKVAGIKTLLIRALRYCSN